MKALMVGMDWFPHRAGGLNHYFYDVAHQLPSVGVEGTALVSYRGQGQTAPFCLRGMAPETASLNRRWRGARSQAREVLREGVDLVNSHFALYIYACLRDLPAGMPLVVNFQGPWAEEIAVESRGLKGRTRALLARHIEQAVYRQASRVITLSEAFRDIAQDRYGVLAERLRVIPGGVDPTFYLQSPSRMEARRRLCWPSDRPILFSVRRLARRMGLESLIEATAEVRRHIPDILLLIGGKGAIQSELEARIQACGLEDNARLLGFIAKEDLPLAYAAADLTVVPTIALEGFGLVTVESLLSGTPVLGTPVGGTQEILRDLDANLLFEDATPTAMADRILTALQEREGLPDREACRAYARRYTWPEILPKIRDVFAEAVEETKRASSGSI